MRPSPSQLRAADISHDPPAYRPIRASRSHYLELRRMRHHVRVWDCDPGRPCAGTLVMLHGWMDVSASFQFLVDALKDNWRVFAPDWRGFGLSARSEADCYWFADYVADLEFICAALLPDEALNLVGHSMGGNVATIYAGVRPDRVRKLVNLEGLGLPPTRPDEAPARLARWLDELRTGGRLRDYSSREEVAERLRATNPRLRPEYAAFLAEHWAIPAAGGRFALACDPAHKIVNATLYRVDETNACWRQIRADTLLVLAGVADRWQLIVGTADYQTRLAQIASLRTVTLEGAGHMLHHDLPGDVAALVEDFVR
ncbi:MAG: alpha/beta hydrolase [Burkholderiaceae bacterium]|nr:alpha/beta hydrolase [Burkholderiaceae bacterium]